MYYNIGKAVITHQPLGKKGSKSSSETPPAASLPLPPEDERAPEIDFLLYYSISSLSLTIHLQRARYLPPKIHKNFVLLLYLAPKTHTGDTLESTVLQDSPEPIINQSIVFKDLKPDEVREQTLVFQLYNGSTMGTLVGGVTLPLSDADLYGMNCTMKIDLDREKIKVCVGGGDRDREFVCVCVCVCVHVCVRECVCEDLCWCALYNICIVTL